MMKSGIPTRELINLYEKFADGDFGTIVTGCIMVNGVRLQFLLVKNFLQLHFSEELKRLL